MEKVFVTLNDAGIAVGIVKTPGEVAGNVVEWPDADRAIIGQQWNGATFVAVPADRKQQIAQELTEIDRKAGMPRLLRETLIAMAGTAAPAILKTHETNAAALRAELAGLK